MNVLEELLLGKILFFVIIMLRICDINMYFMMK